MITSKFVFQATCCVFTFNERGNVEKESNSNCGGDGDNSDGGDITKKIDNDVMSSGKTIRHHHIYAFSSNFLRV